MALFSMTAAVDALDDLLDHERKVILSGEIDTLLRLAPEKERLLERLPGSIDDPATLDRLRGKVARNQDLLVAAARGVKAASARLEALAPGQRNLQTYGRDGARTDLGQGAKGFNKRA